MRGKDPELQRLYSEKMAAQCAVIHAKELLDRISSQRSAYQEQIQSVNVVIDDLKQRIRSEKEAIRICKAARDWIGTTAHQYNLQSYQTALQEQYSIKNSYFTQKNLSQSEFSSALRSLQAAKERKQQAQQAITERLSQLKAQSAAEAQKWRKTTCRVCGQAIPYNIEWTHIPHVCKSCKEARKYH